MILESGGVMKILLVGDRAREHVLAEQLARSSELYVAMQYRNPGILRSAQKCFVCDFANIEAIGGWAIREGIDAALVTSETALAKGLSDGLEEVGVKVASPPSAGTLIGENAVYALNLMKESRIAVPHYAVCKSEKELKDAMKEMPRMAIKPSVKVDWKGTRFIELDTSKSADLLKHGKQLMKKHGSVIVEEVVEGESFSVQGLTDGKSLYVMPPVQIVRRAGEGNQGPLTEGMGGYSSGRLLPFMRQPDLDFARDALWKLVSAMKAGGTDYKGPIRGEFMCVRDGVVMLDAYATFGSVNTLNNMPLLRTQLVEAITSISEGTLKPLSLTESATVSAYLAPQGYPDKSKKTEVGIDDRALWNNGAKAYFESVGLEGGRIGSTQLRTLALYASGPTSAEANSKVNAAAAGVSGALFHRRDIGSADMASRAVKHLAIVRSK